MSRALWHFAVISPTLEQRLRHADKAIEAELVLHSALTLMQEHIACYQSVLDGWNGSYLISEQLGPAYPEVPWFKDLEDRGTLFIDATTTLPHNFVQRGRETLERRGLGNYAAERVLDGFELVHSFSRGTGCTAVVLWRVLGASEDDKSFLKR